MGSGIWNQEILAASIFFCENEQKHLFLDNGMPHIVFYFDL
jgi:hypothetical protein